MADTHQREKGPVGGAFGSKDGGSSNDAQMGGTGPGSLGELARDTDQQTPGSGQSGPGEGQGRGPMSDKASGGE
jgi:hypothetical protein